MKNPIARAMITGMPRPSPTPSPTSSEHFKSRI